MSANGKGLRVSSSGVNATVQDNGRIGYRQHGLAPGGALDLHAFNWANKLLDNPGGAACLEIMIGGFKAEAETDLVVALTGADVPVSVNGVDVGHWRTLPLRAGDTLVIGHARSGRLLYLALPGGIESPTWLGSQSVILRERIEGFSALATGSQLIARDRMKPLVHREVPANFRPDYSGTLTLGLIPGYQIEEFSRNDLLRLTTQEYELTQQSDRMGFRLAGPGFEDAPPGIISEGIAVGSLQIPGDGQPIVLLNDGQTIGGYPKPGVIASLDCHRLAQRLPGQNIRFEFKDVADAQNERRIFNQYFGSVRWKNSGKDLEWY